MSDRFEGKAILFAHEGIEYLHVLAVRANGDKKPHRMAIPVRPAGTKEIPGRVTWEYQIAGDQITVTPSVRVTTNTGPGTPDIETFHSAGVWTVAFERFVPLPEIEWIDGVGDHGQRRRFKELNPGDFVV